MPREIFPSSYVCDCGYRNDHFETTIRELKSLSKRKPQRLGAGDDRHVIIFEGGEMTAMQCPTLGKRLATSDPSRRKRRT